MQEKIYEFNVTQPLTDARREAIGRLIDENAHRSPWPITYSWDEEKTRLTVASKAMNVDVVFHPASIEVFRDAPLWARMLLTKKTLEQMEPGVVKALKDLGFFETNPATASAGAGQ